MIKSNVDVQSNAPTNVERGFTTACDYTTETRRGIGRTRIYRIGRFEVKEDMLMIGLITDSRNCHVLCVRQSATVGQL
jgi:hypothetical protein